MIINSARTMYSLRLQTNMLQGKQHTTLPNTTLNEKLNILPTEVVPTGVYPTIKYFSIGIGGADIVTGLSTYSFSKHKPTDAGLFEEIPFVIKLTTADLTPTEQLQYRFKKLLNINGIEYYGYYMKAIPATDIKDGLYKVSMTNNIPTLSVFDTNTDKLLNPVPRDPTNTLLDLNVTDYIANVIKLKFIMTAAEMLEINNVLDIMYGLGNNKNIREIAVLTGIDKTLNDGSIEATCCEIGFHVEVNIDNQSYLSTSNDFIRSIELGGMEILAL